MSATSRFPGFEAWRVGNRGFMPTYINGYEIRYPGGGFEIVATSGSIPSVGATLRRHGKAWRVINEIHDGRLILEVALVEDTKSVEMPPPR